MYASRWNADKDALQPSRYSHKRAVSADLVVELQSFKALAMPVFVHDEAHFDSHSADTVQLSFRQSRMAVWPLLADRTSPETSN